MDKRMKCKHPKHDEDYVDELLEVLPSFSLECERYCDCDEDGQ